jgi:hypothetical protein
MGIKQSKLMNSEDAPKQWQAVNYQKVMDYALSGCPVSQSNFLDLANHYCFNTQVLETSILKGYWDENQ